jgi:hypothetical protein
LLAALSLVLGVLWTQAPAAAAAGNTPPPVLDCYGQVGWCDGVSIKGPAPVIKLTPVRQNGSSATFTMTHPDANVDTTTTQGCGDAGCLYNHINWTPYQQYVGYRVVSGCGANEPTCTVTIPRGTKNWIPMVATKNDFPLAIFLMWVPKKMSQKGAVEGTIRIEKNGNPTNIGFHGARVNVSGNGFNTTVTVGGDGAYHVEVPKPGRYRVIPTLPPGYTRGLQNPITPASRDVNVKRGKTATADFTVKDSLRLGIDLNRDKVAGDGFQLVKATVKATEFGRPVKGLTVSIRPAGGRVVDVSTLAVPATVCLVGGPGRIWPGGARTPATMTSPVDAVTDARGEIHLTIALGTVPGQFDLQAWARDKSGQLDTASSLLDVNPEVTITTTRLAGGGDFRKGLQAYLEKNPNVELPADAPGLAAELAHITASGAIGSFTYAPIKSTGMGYEAVLVTMSGEPAHLDAAGNVTPGSPGWVLSQSNNRPGTITEQARSGHLPDLPLLNNWLRNAVTEASFPDISGPAIPLAVADYTYFGFGYPRPGGCS